MAESLLLLGFRACTYMCPVEFFKPLVGDSEVHSWTWEIQSPQPRSHWLVRVLEFLRAEGICVQILGHTQHFCSVGHKVRG